MKNVAEIVRNKIFEGKFMKKIIILSISVLLLFLLCCMGCQSNKAALDYAKQYIEADELIVNPDYKNKFKECYELRSEAADNLIKAPTPPIAILDELVKSKDSLKRKKALVIIMVKKITDDQLFQNIVESYNVNDDDFFLKFYSQQCLRNASDKLMIKLSTKLINIFSKETEENIILEGMKNLVRLNPQLAKPLLIKYFESGSIDLRRAEYYYLTRNDDRKLYNDIIASLKKVHSNEALRVIKEIESGKKEISIK
jgi:hypothetical protein